MLNVASTGIGMALGASFWAVVYACVANDLTGLWVALAMLLLAIALLPYVPEPTDEEKRDGS